MKDFLNEQRGDCPDIDIDICGARRDELLDYVYERWGEEHVAMIGSFVTMHARLAIREIAKVFGVPPGEVNTLHEAAAAPAGARNFAARFAICRNAALCR